jgi:ATP-dependent Clp protease ATP-binding subunit ClpC
MNEDPGKQSPPERTLRIPVLLRFLFPGSVVAIPATVPRFATYGSELAALEELDRFLRAYVGRLPGRAVASLTLPEASCLEEVEVPLVALDAPRKLRTPIPVTFPCILVPSDPDRWVLLPTIDHALFVPAAEDFREVVRRDVARLIAARDVTPYERLGLLPGRTHALQFLEIPLDQGPGGGALKKQRRELSAFLQRKRAVALLEEVATPLHLHRDRPAPLVGREKELRSLRALLDGPERAGVLVVGPAGAGKTALIRTWIHRTDRLVYRTSGARLVAGMGAFGQWEERVQDLASALEALDAVLLLEDLEDVLSERVESGGVDIAGGLRPHLDSGKLRLLAEVREDRVDMLERSSWAVFSMLTRVAVPALSAEMTVRAMVERDAHERERDESIPAFAKEALQGMVELAERYLPYEAFPGKALRWYRELRTLHERGLAPAPSDTPVKIGRAEVTSAFSRATGIPGALIADESPLRVESVEAALRADVIGQEVAVRALAETIAVVKAGLQPADKPLATFLFIGPTGVGKTELARSLARYLFGSAERLVRFDMSEFMSSDAAERLIRGTDSDDGLLTRRVRQQPFCVVLLDEIEKAHGAVWDLLLQVCGEGRLTDARGRTVYFRNTLLIMTSNLGAVDHRGPVGFAGRDQSDFAHYQKLVDSAFRPEMVNRIDRIVPFGKLTDAQLESVVGLLIGKIGQRSGFRDHGISLTVTQGAVARMARDGYDSAYGARGLRRYLERVLVAPVARCISELEKAPVDAVVAVRLGEEPEDHGLGVVCARAESGALAVSVHRPKAPSAARVGWGFREIASVRREADGIMRLAGVEEVPDQIAYLVAQIATARRGTGGQQEQQGQRERRSEKDISGMQAEFERLEGLWKPVHSAHEEIRALEELAFAAVLSGQSVDELVRETALAQDRFREALPYVLLALEPRRDEGTFLLEELDEGAFDPWLVDLLQSLRKRRWNVALHVHGDTGPGEAPPGGTWGPARSIDEVLSLMNRGQAFRNLLLRCRGPFAGVLIGLEAGLHTMIAPPWRMGKGPARDSARTYLHFISLDYDLAPEQWKHPALAPPRPSSAGRRKKGTAAREWNWTEQRIRIAGKCAVLSMDLDRYFLDLERVALALLLVVESDDTALSRDQLYLPAWTPDEA